jgi:hypothetical protein
MVSRRPLEQSGAPSRAERAAPMSRNDGVVPRRLVAGIACLGAAAATLVAVLAASAAPATVTVAPTADSYVQSDQPATNYGTQSQIRADGSPTVRAYLRFDPQGLTGAVTRAVLRLHTNSAHAVG